MNDEDMQRSYIFYAHGNNYILYHNIIIIIYLLNKQMSKTVVVTVSRTERHKVL